MSPLPFLRGRIAKEFAAQVTALADDRLDQFVEHDLLLRRPHIFSTDGDWTRFREFVVTELALGGEQPEVYIVGSGLTGFSLAPDRYFAPFSDASDIDVPLFTRVRSTQLRQRCFRGTT